MSGTQLQNPYFNTRIGYKQRQQIKSSRIRTGTAQMFFLSTFYLPDLKSNSGGIKLKDNSIITER